MLKLKMGILYPIFKIKAIRSRRIAKKMKKDPGKYPIRWRFEYVMKYSKKILKALNIDFEVIGYENLPKGAAILVSNHMSSLDGTLVCAAMEKQTYDKDIKHKTTSFIVKKELAKNKKFSGYLDMLDVFYMDRDNARDALKIMNEIPDYIKENKKYITIFPAGTRSKKGTVGEFKSGAFRIAKKAFLPMVPVTINNTLSATDLSRKDRLKVTITFHKAMKPMSFISQPTSIIAQRVQRIVESKWVKPEGQRPKAEKDLV